MTVGGHGDQVAALTLADLDKLLGRAAQGKDGPDVKAFRREFSLPPLQVPAVAPDLFRILQVQLLLVAGDKAVGDVDQHQARVQGPGHGADVAQDDLVGRRVLQCYEDGLVHHRPPSQRDACMKRRYRLSPAMAAVTVQAAAFISSPLAKAPILAPSLVNSTRGTTAKDSCIERM